MRCTCRVIFFFLLIFLSCSPSEIITATVTPNLNHIILKYSQKLDKKILFGPVSFTHQKHFVDYELTCLTCHHQWKTNEKNAPQKCNECHKLTVSDSPRKIVLLRNAFHRSCKDCHYRLRDENKPTGPVKCKGCHE